MINKGLNARNYILNNFGDINENFASLKENLCISDLLDFFSKLETTDNYRDFFYNHKENDYNTLVKGKYFPAIYLARNINDENIKKNNLYELRFLIALICYHKEIVNNFLILRNNFEHAFMSSCYSEAESYLNELESAYGYSFWSIEARLALYSVGGMKQTAFEYCKNVTNNNSKYITLHVEILRDKMSLDMNQALFRDRFDNNINLMKSISDYEYHIVKCLQAYTHFSCFIAEELTDKVLRDVLVSASVLSIIDKYVLLEKIIISISTKPFNEYNKFIKILKECLNELSKNIPNTLWENIGFLIGDFTKITINDRKKTIQTALSYFCANNHKKCWEFCRKELKHSANNFSLINLMAKIDSIGQPKVQYEYLVEFINILYKKSLDEKEFYYVANVSDIFERFYSNFTFGNELISIVENEFSHNVNVSKKQYIYAMVRCNYTPSKLAFFIPEENKKLFIEQYKKELNQLYLCDWQLMTYNDIIKESIISEFICDEISLKLLQVSKEPQKYIEKIPEKYKFLILSYNKKLLFDFYVKNSSYKEAIATYVEAYFLNKWLVLKIDYMYLNNKITKNLEQILGSSIEYCVYCMLTKFNTQEAEKISESVVSSYKRIMRKNNEFYPSNLLWPDSELYKKCHAYFLRFVCTEDVLHRCNPPFDLQQDINEERKNILMSLLNYYKVCQDDKSVDVLEKEVKTLSESTQTLDIINLLDEAKIDLNWILFNDTTDDAIVLAYNRCFIDGSDKLSISNNNNERYHEFLAGLSSCKKNYVSEVNRILSLCIRHGVLEDQIILFLNRHNIVRDESLHNNTFFNKVYETINSVIENHIIATGESGENSKISLYIPEAIAEKSYAKISSGINSPEELKAYYFEILNSQLEKELIKIGEIVFQKLYYSLEKSLNNFIQCSKGIDTNNFIQCRDSLESELLIIKQWFKIIEYRKTQYNLTTFLNVFKTKYPKIKIEFNVDVNYKIQSSIICCLYNILFNFFNNASKHSGFSEYSDELGLCLSIIQNDDLANLFVFNLSNNVSEDLDNEIIINYVDRINSLIENKEKIETYSRMEGKSGYQKIIRILERNFKDKWELSVSFDKNNRKFNVRLFINLE